VRLFISEIARHEKGKSKSSALKKYTHKHFQAKGKRKERRTSIKTKGESEDGEREMWRWLFFHFAPLYTFLKSFSLCATPAVLCLIFSHRRRSPQKLHLNFKIYFLGGSPYGSGERFFSYMHAYSRFSIHHVPCDIKSAVLRIYVRRWNL
jgi:hypothetical protein